MKRGRPNEQLRRLTGEGRVWQIVGKSAKVGNYSLTVRRVASMVGLSVGAVAKTWAWRIYTRLKGDADRGKLERAGRLRRPRQAETVDVLAWQVICRFIKCGNWDLTARELADMIGCSLGAIGKTAAWKGYMNLREAEKARNKARLSERAHAARRNRKSL